MDRQDRHPDCELVALMTHGTVVLVGSLPVEHLARDLLVAEFSWCFKKADSLRCLAELNILCHGFAETVDWPQAADAGAFHSLLWPFDVREIRQSRICVRAMCRSATIRYAIARTKEESSVNRAAPVQPGLYA